MRIPASLRRTARTLYLYPDGHAVVVHQRLPGEGGSWATAHQRVIEHLRIPAGRLIIAREAIPLVLAARDLRIDRSAGTSITKQLGLQAVELSLNLGLGLAIFHLIPDVISSDISWQSDAAPEAWEDLHAGEEWGVQDLKHLYPATAAAAA